jgi:hypothetical protein
MVGDRRVVADGKAAEGTGLEEGERGRKKEGGIERGGRRWQLEEGEGGRSSERSSRRTCIVDQPMGVME